MTQNESRFIFFQICEDHFVEIRNVQIPVNRIHPVFIEAIVASAAEYVFVIDFSGDDPLVTGVYFRRVLIQCGMPQKAEPLIFI